MANPFDQENVPFQGPSQEPSDVDLENIGPEIKSYIYQILSEFEPFTSPQTTVAVIAKDPMHLFGDETVVQEWDSAEMLKRMYRISIALQEDGSKLEAEGLDTDIFLALKKAKDNLLKTLIEIHDNVVDTKERNQHIHSVLSGAQTLH